MIMFIPLCLFQSLVSLLIFVHQFNFYIYAEMFSFHPYVFLFSTQTCKAVTGQKQEKWLKSSARRLVLVRNIRKE